MPKHEDALVSFEVPRDWRDRTVVAYAAPPKAGQLTSANLVMTRDEIPDDESFEQYVERQLLALEERMKGFVLEARDEDEVAGRPAVVLTFGSSGVDGPLAQRLTILPLPGRRVVSITVTAPVKDAAQLAPLFDRIISSLTLAAEEVPA
jgi:hypothetical protein